MSYLLASTLSFSRTSGSLAFVAMVMGAGMCPAGGLEAQEHYRVPPSEIVEILEAPTLPELHISPTGEWVALLGRPNMLALEEIARPRLHLAGYRLNPRTNGPSASRTPRGDGIELVELAEGRRVSVLLPPESAIEHVSWSPDGNWLSFARIDEDGYELWAVRGDGSGLPERIGQGHLNAAHGNPCRWLFGGRELLCRFVDTERGSPPTRPAVPESPGIQEATGEPAPARTFQDLLQDAHDAELFEYYFTSQLTLVEVETGRTEPVGGPAIIDEFLPSPDARFVYVARTVRPFSFIVPDRWRINDWFPREMEIWNGYGDVIREIASLPLEENVPVDDVRSGPRGVMWQPGEEATLVWAEDLEGEVPGARERVFRLVDLQGEPEHLLDLEDRFNRMEWTTDGRGLVTEVDRYPLRAASWTRTWLVDTSQPHAEPRLVWDRSAEERYDAPGNPVTRGGTLLRDQDWIYLHGDGVRPDGERPFVDRMNLRTLETERVWESDPERHESPVALATEEAHRLVIRSESPTDPPNFYRVDRDRGGRIALTDQRDPHPQLQGAKRQVLTYAREDGVRLAGVVHTPPEWDGETRLPTVVWAYPREFVSAAAAAQVPGQDNRFTRISGASHMFFLLNGYAVFDGPSIAILGGRTANDTYVEQLVSSTEAAVDAVVDVGIADPDRIGVGGHSYGGFMTQNLLAHSDLFKAGIAGAASANRTLTPFGFQNETRTIWEAPEVYIQMSPFLYAHQIEAPILLMHGADDPNPGTHPMQSERMFHALKGMGKVSRLVMLNYEDHGYGARESIFHAIAEMIDWFDQHVKNVPARATDGHR